MIVIDRKDLKVGAEREFLSAYGPTFIRSFRSSSVRSRVGGTPGKFSTPIMKRWRTFLPLAQDDEMSISALRAARLLL